MKLVISNKEGKARQVEIDKDGALAGMRIGEKFDGSVVGLDGFEFEIRGGSDIAGLPMRRDAQGTERRKILITGGTGAHISEEGKKIKKSVRGNTVSSSISQLNLFAVKVGNPEFFNVAKAEKKEEKKK